MSNFLNALVERALKTLGQTGAALLVSQGADVVHISWQHDLVIVGLATLGSVLTSLASLSPITANAPVLATEPTPAPEPSPVIFDPAPGPDSSPTTTASSAVPDVVDTPASPVASAPSPGPTPGN